LETATAAGPPGTSWALTSMVHWPGVARMAPEYRPRFVESARSVGPNDAPDGPLPLTETAKPGSG
jgi:hypothetical protein